jgi:hypothetical protein
MNKLIYKIIKIEADGRPDSAVVSNAEEVINEYAALGWRLHTYSYMAADAGGARNAFAATLAGAPSLYQAKNLLHLIFEKERGMSKEEREEAKILAQKKAEAAAYLEEMRNKREKERENR